MTITRLLLLISLCAMACLTPVLAAPANYAVEVPDVLAFQKGAVVALPPMRDLLGLQVSQQNTTFSCTRQGKSFVCTVDSTSAKANGKALTLPLAPFTRAGVLFVPIRALIETLGGSLTITGTPKVVQITMPGLAESLALPFVDMVTTDDNGAKVPVAVKEFRDFNNQLYVMNPDGSGLKRLTYNFFSTTLPACSADGNQWVYLRTPPLFPIGSVYARSADSAQHQCIQEADWENTICLDAAISPDGTAIWYSKATENECNIYRIPLAGGAAERIAEGVSPCITPDGITLVYHGKDNRGTLGIVIKNLTDGQEDSIANGENPLLSPDGKTVLFMRAYSQTQDAPSFIVTCRIDGDLNAPVQHEADAKARNYEESDPAFTPDSRYILFTRLESGNMQSQGIFIMNADRSACKQLTTGNDHTPVCAPDGTAIYFIRNSRVYRMKMDGTQLKPITDESISVNNLRFSPDGSKLFLLVQPQALFG